MKAVVAAFNQEKALVGAFSVIVQPVVEPMENYTALVKVAGEDVVLGFSDMAGYTSGAGRGKNPYMGAVVGRVANRIAEAKFVLDGKEYNLAKVGYTTCVSFLCSIFIFLE